MVKKRIDEKEVLKYLVSNSFKTIKELSKELNISKNWLYKFCKKEKIDIAKFQPNEKQLKKNPTLKRFSESEWLEIEKEIDSESQSIIEISKQFNISPNSVYKHFNKLGRIIKSTHTPSIRKLFKHINKTFKKKINKDIKNAEKEAIKKFKCINCEEKAVGFFQGKALCQEHYKQEYQKVHSHRFFICQSCGFSMRIYPKFKLINLCCKNCGGLISRQKELINVYQ